MYCTGGPLPVLLYLSLYCCTPLPVYLLLHRLSSGYNMLLKLRFFKHFRIAKAFRHWHAIVKQIHYR